MNVIPKLQPNSSADKKVIETIHHPWVNGKQFEHGRIPADKL